MSLTIPKRIEWAVEILAVKPDDRILEIGCGNGAAVSLICERLTTGRITAIDRSEKMVALARERNAAEIKCGTATIHHADLLETGLPSEAFNKVFLFNLNVFWMDPVAELNEVRRLLAPSGTFFIFHNPPPGADLREYVDAIAENLKKNRFKTDEPILEPSVSSLCIRSTPL